METLTNEIFEKRIKDHHCCTFEEPYTELKIAVKGIGPLPLPLKPKICKQLIEQAKPAYFGYKEKTLYDQKIRHSWEIKADAITIEEASWEKILNPALNKIKKNLLIPKEICLTAKLHNLLIYEKNQFFKPHQDSEKEDGMLASLTILLPSRFRGGSFVVSHRGNKQEFNPSETSTQKLTFQAFYADCLHEVQPVRSGYRVALTYNLFVQGESKKLFQKRKTNWTEAIQSYFKTAKQSKHAMPWLVYLLDHQYTPASLSWKRLKGADQINASHLISVAKSLDLEIHLSLADMHETWSAYEKHEDFYYSNRNRYRFWKGYSDTYTKKIDLDELEIEDFIDNETTLDCWLDLQDNPAKLGSAYIEEQAIFKSIENKEFKPYHFEYEGYMGNYGNTLDRWYKRAAIVLWPRKDFYRSRYYINSEKTTQSIIQLLKSKQRQQEGLHALKQVLPQISTHYDLNKKQQLEIALYCKETKIATKVISNFDHTFLLSKLILPMKNLVVTYGEDFILDIFNKNTKKREDSFSNRLEFKKLEAFLLKARADLPKLSKAAIHFGISIGASRLHSLQEDLPPSKRSIRNFAEDLATLLRSAQLLSDQVLFDKMLTLLEKSSHLLNPISTAYVLMNLHKDQLLSANFKAFIDAISKELKHISTRKYKNNDWSIETRSLCKCELCLKLNKYLNSTNSQNEVWPLAKNKRQHLHQVIEQLEIPVTHITQHIGSPHKLHLNKTKELFEERKNHIQAAKKSLTLLTKHFAQQKNNNTLD